MMHGELGGCYRQTANFRMARLPAIDPRYEVIVLDSQCSIVIDIVPAIIYASKVVFFSSKRMHLPMIRYRPQGRSCTIFRNDRITICSDWSISLISGRWFPTVSTKYTVNTEVLIVHDAKEIVVQTSTQALPEKSMKAPDFIFTLNYGSRLSNTARS